MPSMGISGLVDQQCWTRQGGGMVPKNSPVSCMGHAVEGLNQQNQANVRSEGKMPAAENSKGRTLLQVKAVQSGAASLVNVAPQ
jgi:hypothetical protein